MHGLFLDLVEMLIKCQAWKELLLDPTTEKFFLEDIMERLSLFAGEKTTNAIDLTKNTNRNKEK